MTILPMAGNRSLNAAMKSKQDEFYTQIDDISNELKHYRNPLAELNNQPIGRVNYALV